jgi:L-rhamnose mutarotase
MQDNKLDISHYLSRHKDPFPVMKVLLSYPLCNWINEYFLYTRDFEGGLYFVNYCRSIISANMKSIAPCELQKWDKYLIVLKLNMLDLLNLWQEYIDYFDTVFDSKLCNLRGLYKERYDIIKRKLIRKNTGANVEHLKRHQACRLTEYEIKMRYEAIINRLNSLIKDYSKPRLV